MAVFSYAGEIIKINNDEFIHGGIQISLDNDFTTINSNIIENSLKLVQNRRQPEFA